MVNVGCGKPDGNTHAENDLHVIYTQWILHIHVRLSQGTSQLHKQGTTSPFEFQRRRCDPNSVGYRNYPQARACRISLLSSMFAENCFTYKISNHFNKLDIGGFFALLQHAPSLSTTAHTRTHHVLQNAPCRFQDLHLPKVLL